MLVRLLAGAVLGGSLALVVRSLAAPDVERPVLESVGPAAADESVEPALRLAGDGDAAVAAGRNAVAGTDGTRTATFDADFGPVVIGRVVDEDGRPVTRAVIRVRGDDGTALRPVPSATGHWSAFGLAAGGYDVEVEALGYLTQLEAFEIEGAANLECETVLEKAAEIPVRFETPNGKAITLGRWREPGNQLGLHVADEPHGSSVELTVPVSEGGPLAELRRHDPFEDEQLQIDERYGALLVLRAALPLWVASTWHDQVLESRRVEPGTEELVFVIDIDATDRLHGSVRVRCVGRESGEALTTNIVLQERKGRRRFEPDVVNDALVFGEVPPGWYTLGFAPGQSRLGWESFELDVEVEPAIESDLGVVQVRKAARVQVVVTDPNGQPVDTYVQIARQLEPGEGRPEERERTVRTRSGANGEVSLRFLALGPSIIRVGGNDGHALVAVEVDTREVDPVRITVPAGVATTFEWLVDHGPDANVLVEDSDGLLITKQRPDQLHLLPGDYVLRILVGADEVHRQAFVVDERPTQVEVGPNR